MSAKKRRNTVFDPTLAMTERVSVRLTHWQAHELREVCKEKNVTRNVLIRELIDLFLKKYGEKREEQGRPLPKNPGDL